MVGLLAADPTASAARRVAGESLPQDLIHTNYSPKPLFMRVSSVFEVQETPMQQAIKSPCPVSFLIGWRAAHGVQTTT